ncbi:MAG: hypothetical protein GY940_33015, partial [bacterium]|nr:hypothetical protein [bacterium]
GGSNPLFRQSFSTHLNQLEKQLQLAGSFPDRQLIEILTAGDTRFNAILVGNQKGSTGGEAGVISRLGGILNHIARDTGGKSVHTVSPERGMQELVNHKDHFYRLVYRFDNKMEDKSTRVTGNGKTFKFLYNYTVKKDRLQNRVQYLNGKRVTVSGVSVKENILRFSIGSITFHNSEAFGLVKVRVQLLDNTGASVYRSENTLRSTKHDVTISLPLPPNTQRASKLVIHACDLVANQLESFTKTL